MFAGLLEKSMTNTGDIHLLGLWLLPVTFRNNCGANVQPVIANVNCGYSPRCDTPGSGGVVFYISKDSAAIQLTASNSPIPQYRIRVPSREVLGLVEVRP